MITTTENKVRFDKMMEEAEESAKELVRLGTTTSVTIAIIKIPTIKTTAKYQQ